VAGQIDSGVSFQLPEELGIDLVGGAASLTEWTDPGRLEGRAERAVDQHDARLTKETLLGRGVGDGQELRPLRVVLEDVEEAPLPAMVADGALGELMRHEQRRPQDRHQEQGSGPRAARSAVERPVRQHLRQGQEQFGAQVRREAAPDGVSGVRPQGELVGERWPATVQVDHVAPAIVTAPARRVTDGVRISSRAPVHGSRSGVLLSSSDQIDASHQIMC
jgi:hypothetical protein